jgi:putative ABC transport system permease protein
MRSRRDRPHATPPRLGTRLLGWLLPDEERSETLGDFEERFQAKVRGRGAAAARIWYGLQVLCLIPYLFKDHVLWSCIMFRNNLVIAWRNVKKHKGFSLINIAGLVLGFTFFILISIYIRYEFGYDRFHKNAGSIYRVISKSDKAVDGSVWWNATSGLLKSTLLNECPDVKNAARLCLWKSIINLRGLFSAGGDSYFESAIYIVDPEFLEIFSFPLVAGDPRSALKDPFSILLTRRMAEKYFGHEDPVGKTLVADNAQSYKVTGVLENVPANSHVHFDFLISFSTIYAFPEGNKGNVENWGSQNYITYAQLAKGARAENVQALLPAIIKKYRGEKFENNYFLDPLTRIHLHSNINLDLEANNSIFIVYVMSAIALVILLIACFNYMNLSTARSVLRSKEVGIRKVVGADRRQLVRQFIGESLLFSLMAILVSLVLARFLLPAFGRFMDRDLRFSLVSGHAAFIVLVFGAALAVGLLAGFYPALFLSAFKPVDAVKRAFRSQSRSPLHVRNILVVFQFAASVGLVICALAIHGQLAFIRNKDLGFHKDHIVAVRIQDKKLRENHEPLLEALKQQARILDVTASDDLPHAIVGGGSAGWEGKTKGQADPNFNNAFVDENFLDFYGVEIVAGRNFSKERPADDEAYIVNEAAVRAMGIEDPVGKRFRLWKGEGTIIGVVKDFHSASLRQGVGPVVLSLIYQGDDRYLRTYGVVNYYSIKIGSTDVPGTIKLIESTYKRFTDYPFSLTFLDERVEAMYRAEQRLGRCFITFSLMAIFIACLGLVGLASFTAEQKTKEIGIRKVLGASTAGIIALLSRDFMKWVVAANIIAWPVGYFAMRSWLRNFAYRIDLTVPMFLGAALAAFVIAAAVIGLQTYRAAAANPADSMRYE